MFAFREILEVLGRHGVEFVVGGGLAGVLHGSPIPTRDVDVVHARTPANIARLLGALHELHATYRNDPLGLSPGESHLKGPGHQLLTTRSGQLDVLGALGQGLEHAQLSADAVEFDLGGAIIRVVSRNSSSALRSGKRWFTLMRRQVAMNPTICPRLRRMQVALPASAAPPVRWMKPGRPSASAAQAFNLTPAE